ncbi:MAG: hypothetical protein M1503_04095 [Thaumarchaeota archaeon]|nr:hypothetical protein [Nitrososphaerota archaeon]MCL5317434.1 hypothetical protein [Nitrososphaerota archaeon]
MSLESSIVEASKYLEELEAKYGKLRRITGLIGRWFSRDHRLFFDCENEFDLAGCVGQIVSSPNVETLIVYFLVRMQDGSCQLRDSRFKNIYGQSLKRMIEHFHNILEPSIRHGMQVARLVYVECIGYGVVIEERILDTVSDISEIANVLHEETDVKYEAVESEGAITLRPVGRREQQHAPAIEEIRISDGTLALYAPKDKTLKKPDSEAAVEWDEYLRHVQWKDAMTLNIRETFYGIMVTFDGELVRYKVELGYPVEVEKLRKACHALEETQTLQ